MTHTRVGPYIGKLLVLAVFGMCHGESIPPLPPTQETLCAKLFTHAETSHMAMRRYVQWCIVPHLPPPAPVPDLRRYPKQPMGIG